MDDEGVAVVKVKVDQSSRRGAGPRGQSSRKGPPHSKSGKGVIQPKRRGLGEERTRGPSTRGRGSQDGQGRKALMWPDLDIFGQVERRIR